MTVGTPSSHERGHLAAYRRNFNEFDAQPVPGFMLAGARPMEKLCVSAAIFALCASPGAARDDELIGCWATRKIVQYFADGSQKTDITGACSLQFTESTITNRCRGPRGGSIIEYSYQHIKQGVYRGTIVGHNLRPDLIGATRNYEYEVTPTALIIWNEPQTAKPAPHTAAIAVISESRRVECRDRKSI